VDIVTGLEADIIARIGTPQTATAAATGWMLIYDEIQISPDEESPLVRAELTLNDIVPEITWEVIPTMVELHILETPVAWNLRNYFYNSDESGRSLLREIKARINDPDKQQEDFTSANVVGPAGPIPTGGLAWDVANAIVRLGIIGVERVPRYLPCLRLSQNVSSRYDNQLSVTFVGDVLSTTRLYILEGVPSDVLFSFPVEPTPRTGHTYGWLKGAPSIRRTGRGLFSIQQDWQFGEYPSDPAGLFTFIP